MARKKRYSGSNPSWWELKEDEAVGAMLQKANDVREQMQPRVAAYLHFARLYYGYELSGLGPDGFSDEPDPIDSEPLTENVARSCVQAALPRACKTKPRAMFLTKAGQWSDRVRAHRLEQVVAGDFYRAKIYQKWRQMIRDGAIFGTGYLRHYERNGRPETDRVFPWCVCVDSADAYHGNPRNLFYWQYFDKRVLAKKFPKKEDAIMSSTPGQDNYYMIDGVSGNTGGTQDQILVWHAWHLPSDDEAEDGAYMIGAGQDIELDRDDWKSDYFPFTIYHWDTPVIGFHGEGLVRQISGHQYELCAIDKTIRQSLRHAVPRTYVPYGSQIRPSDLDDRVGTIIEYVGNVQPTTSTPSPIHPTYLNWRTSIKASAFEDTGVSQMSAYSARPPGVTAAKALQLYEDVEDTRFITPAEAAEQAIIDIATQYVRIRKEIAASGGENKVLNAYQAQRKIWRTIDWSDVDLDADCYTTMVYPVSQLPSTPAGRTDLVEAWFAAGIISPDERRQLLDLPDVEAYSDLRNAPTDWVWSQVESMLMDGKPATPDPTVGPDIPLRIGRGAYIAAMRDGCPEAHLELMRDYLDKCVAMLNQSNEYKPQETQPGMPMGPAPDGSGSMLDAMANGMPSPLANPAVQDQMPIGGPLMQPQVVPQA